jgi:hypothetical protein
MIDESAAMRAWLDAHDLGDSELLHQLPNQGPEGADRMTDPERLVLSALLEGRRAVVPGYQATPTNRPGPQDRAHPAELVGLFDPSPPRSPRAAVEPAGHRPRPTGRPAAPHHRQPPAGLRRQQRERDEEQER